MRGDTAKKTKKAFWSRGTKSQTTSSNTQVVVADGYVRCFLFGNEIAIRSSSIWDIRITDAGWPTATTKRRLNQLLEPLRYRVYQHKKEWYIADLITHIDIKWDGSDIWLSQNDRFQEGIPRGNTP